MAQPGPNAATGPVVSNLHPAPLTPSEGDAPVAGLSIGSDSLATATVTNLDATWAQRANGLVS